ncbi:ATP-binding cassette sub-family G member 4 [Drosophila hydei]|uniref:ATP-binding cassette sub-family G member 4 n=1 Tax=Drosophila hydei TaxID=7224 RepID=A0A6J1MEW2_DROHY|nr:ATP-binding cassette sub-family G member 4 [Drosophila hydei]XP_023177521.2 ATP-binding cassette sub-family G member 4 [Drosophila hydei]
MLSAREQFFNSDGGTPGIGLGIEIGESGTAKPGRGVYNATTVPMTSASSWRNGQTNTTTTATPTGAAPIASSKQTPLEPVVEDEEDFHIDTNALSNLPPRDPVDIEFKELSLTVKLGFNRGEKEILHNVCGKFPGSQLIAIMGPSGAGKSTLLDALSGFKTTGVDGSIRLNGRRRDLPSFRRMSCYITQDDRLQPLLTVTENMHIAADLKLGENVSYEEKESRIEDILLLLGLYDHDQTLTGRLSGGQKKRLSIAMELINNPTVMFLDEPTTGLDSSSCTKVLELLKRLTTQGRTIICTIHQPTAKLFQIFDQVYVLSSGNCVYQGGTQKMVPFLQSVELPCPMYHNPADYIIELACGEYGFDKIDTLKTASENGSSLTWFNNPGAVLRSEALIHKHPIPKRSKNVSLENTSFMNQCTVLLRRGYIKSGRDTTLTHLRLFVNIAVAVLYGAMYDHSGKEGSRVLDNYNLLFAILMHHSMTTMMLTVLTFPLEMTILIKEHFNRWYSLKAYYFALTLLEIPITFISTFVFTVIIYLWSYQPMEWVRFWMFFVISLLVVFVGQSFGLIIGAWCNVVNGTFLAPVLTIPMMMFAGFGVTLRDLPSYLKWGSHISHLRYGLEGYIAAIYGMNRGVLDCNEAPYCHYRYPKKFLEEITMSGDQFWNDLMALSIILLLFRVGAYFVLKAKLKSIR